MTDDHLNARAEAERFRVAIEQARAAGPRDGIDPRVHEAMIAGMESEEEELWRVVRRHARRQALRPRPLRLFRDYRYTFELFGIAAAVAGVLVLSSLVWGGFVWVALGALGIKTLVATVRLDRTRREYERERDA